MKNKKMLVELTAPFFLLAIALFVIITSYQYGKEGQFPRLVGYGLLISVLVMFYTVLVKKEIVTNFASSNLKAVLLTVIAMIIYILAMPYTGYFLATLCLGSFIVYLLGYRNLMKNLFLMVIVTACVFIIFKVLLKVNLPTILLNI